VVDGEGRIVGITSHKLGGDNVAFLASSTALLELIEAPEKRVIGGAWGVAIGSSGGIVDNPVSNIEASLQGVVRDRLVATVSIGYPIQARSLALERGSSWGVTNQASLAIRQRLGHGSWSTAIELGGGISGLRSLQSTIDPDTHRALFFAEERWVPGGLVRVGMGGAWLKTTALWEDGEAIWLIGVDLDWPGTLGTF